MNDDPVQRLKEKQTINLVPESAPHVEAFTDASVVDDTERRSTVPSNSHTQNSTGLGSESRPTPAKNEGSPPRYDPNELTPWKKTRGASPASAAKSRKFLSMVIALLVISTLGAVASAIASIPKGLPLLETQIGCALGNRDIILDGYKRGWHNDPAYVEVMIALANQRAEVDKVAAEALYDDCVRINPNYARCYLIRGLNYARLGEDKKVLPDYEKALALNPQYALAYNNRGCFYMYTGEVDRALSDFDQALKYAPRRADFYFNRGRLYRKMNQPDKALLDFNRAELFAAPSNRGLRQQIKSEKNIGN